MHPPPPRHSRNGTLEGKGFKVSEWNISLLSSKKYYTCTPLYTCSICDCGGEFAACGRTALPGFFIPFIRWTKATDLSIGIGCMPAYRKNYVRARKNCIIHVQTGTVGFNTGKGEKLRYSQPEPGQASSLVLLSFSTFPVLNPAAPPCMCNCDGDRSRTLPHIDKHARSS